jgi:D-serine deaminase-like pyridoxal phosphate-dependent protein
MASSRTAPPDIPTPYLAVDRDVLDRNVAAMAASARDRGLALRPHAKTHKCREIARRQLDAGAAGLTVATVSEAEIFAAAGSAEVFIAYPVWADHDLGKRLRSVAERCSLQVGVDSVDGARMLARHGAGGVFDILVEIDSGQHRTGVPPEAAADVAVAAARAGLTVRGVFTFPGHGYGPGRAAAAARDEEHALRHASAAVRSAGIPVAVRSGGSTPTAALTEAAAGDAGGMTELRPGVYVFGDAQQFELGTCTEADIALTAVATVVSRAPGRVVLDAGSKTLGADRPPWTTGFGRLPDYPDARVSALSEHHATVSWPAGSPRPELGDTLRVMPNHVCAAVNLADDLTVVAGGTVVDRWPVAARGANT